MKRDNFQFLGHYGDVALVVRIEPYWGKSCYLSVNQFIKGIITEENGQWIGYFPNCPDYTAADVSILADLIEAKKLLDER